jgi:hypothetical protein
MSNLRPETRLPAADGHARGAKAKGKAPPKRISKKNLPATPSPRGFGHSPDVQSSPESPPNDVFRICVLPFTTNVSVLVYPDTYLRTDRCQAHKYIATFHEIAARKTGTIL